MRVDTTVVECNIHCATDSRLLVDGVLVLTRTMNKITRLTGTLGARPRDQSRNVRLRMLEIARAAGGEAPPNRDRLST